MQQCRRNAVRVGFRKIDLIKQPLRCNVRKPYTACIPVCLLCQAQIRTACRLNGDLLCDRIWKAPCNIRVRTAAADLLADLIYDQDIQLLERDLCNPPLCILQNFRLFLKYLFLCQRLDHTKLVIRILHQS